MQTIRPQMIEILGTKEMTAIELSHEGLGDVGAADKAAIQLVKVQPYQLLVSDT